MPNPPPRLNWQDSDPDEALLAASLTDGDAFAVLVVRYERKLYGLLWRLCPRPDEIDDLYQQVWIKAWGARLGFQGRSRFGTWLYAIALNQVREWRRRQRPQVDIESLPEAATPQASALDRLLGKDRQRQLQTALRQLSDMDQRLLSLRYLQELDYAEIAKLEGGSLAQIRLKAFRALQRLRARLEQESSDL
jgi:RNA polymerase sigma-70 factor (ECF subfamily)